MIPDKTALLILSHRHAHTGHAATRYTPDAGQRLPALLFRLFYIRHHRSAAMEGRAAQPLLLRLQRNHNGRPARPVLSVHLLHAHIHRQLYMLRGRRRWHDHLLRHTALYK